MSNLTPAQRIQALLDTLRRSFDGDAWHGPALADLLRGVDAQHAVAHPVTGAHSIWELTLHLAVWTREVARRLSGAVPAEPTEGDWPDGATGDSAGVPTYAVMLTGLAEHNAYHGGQIALLRRALGNPPSTTR